MSVVSIGITSATKEEASMHERPRCPARGDAMLAGIDIAYSVDMARSKSNTDQFEDLP